jgi:hypothetical protein
MNTHTQSDSVEVPLWNAIPRAVRIVHEGGYADFTRATSFFIALKRIEIKRIPILALWRGDVAASEASVGALNLYLGTVGLAGLARRMDVQGCRTVFDLAGLFHLIGFTVDERESVQRTA